MRLHFLSELLRGGVPDADNVPQTTVKSCHAMAISELTVLPSSSQPILS